MYPGNQKNNAADALSRIPTRAQSEQEYFASDKITEDDENFTLNLNHIAAEQKTCPDLIERLWSNKNTFTKRNFGATEFVCIVDERDKATGWPEIMGIDNKRSELIATLFGNEWLSRYPRPRRVVHDNGGEFVGLIGP